jgi:hypothetical protein
MKLALVNYNKGQMPKNIKEALNLCTIYSRKDIETYLQENPGGKHEVNTGAYSFAFCEKGYEYLYKKEGE